MLRLRARRAVPVALLLAAGLLSGCSADEDPSAAGTAPVGSPEDSDSVQYVALGDSFTAAPGVPTTDTTSFCLRSDGNYPSLVAAELDADLVDASCSGATTTHLVSPQTYGDDTHPPQLDALDTDVDLVTLSIGGNDFNLFGMLIGRCTQLAAGVTDPGEAPCREQMRADGRDDLRERTDRIRDRVATALRSIERRAPDAQVVVVGYPQLVPARGSCPSLLPLAPGDHRYARSINLAMTRAVEEAAADAGADYVDLWQASAGHDICADDPWVSGQHMAPGALPYHPFAAEQQAAATLVLDVVEDDVARRAD